MTKTQSFSILNDKFNALSLAIDQNAQEIEAINQKINAFTGMLQTLTQIVQELTEASSQWRQRPTTLKGPSIPNFSRNNFSTNPKINEIGISKVQR